MSTSTWGGPEPYDGETYPPALLKHLLKHMMAQFAAHGACIALPDESIDQMRIRMHVRVRDIYAMQPPGSLGPGNLRAPRRPLTIHLEHDKPSSLPVRPRPIPSALSASSSVEELDEVPPQQCELFAAGSAYPIGKDLIGYAWRKREAYVMSHDEYLTVLHDGLPACQMDIIPSSYLVVPIMEPTLIDEMRGRRRQPRVVAVVVLYQAASGPGFQQKQRAEAMQYVERIALYLQNDRLQRAQQRTSEYLQRLQAISTAFPTSVKLSDLVESIYNFTAQVVDASSMLLTLYDRDTERIYDVFALRNGTRVDIFTEQPSVMLKEERPTWWQVTQTEKQMLHFSPAQEPQKASSYRELLSGVWGDQRQAESFLLLPMKMFNRVIGSLAITSMHPNAYHQEEIQVLETMTQIVTVSIENAKLYERDRQLLREAKQREGQLAAINSALQSIGSELNVSTLLNNFVQSVATMVKVDVCVFFQFSAARGDLFANAIYGSSIITLVDDGSGVPPVTRPPRQAEHDKLINMIRLPFKGSFLEQMAREGFFYLDTSQMEELAQQCEEGGAIFLRETHMQQMFMIPMSSQTEMIGILAVPIFTENRFFRPKEIGTLLAICAQATSAIRNAQLFEQREEAYAELERMNKLKDEFLVTASHELRTPLSAISGYSSLLKRQSGRISSQQVLRFANKIAGAAQQLTDQVANMTEAANLGAVDKKLELKIGPVQLLSAAEVAVNMLTLSIEQKIAFHVDPILWVNGDGLHVRQVMTNLLENAAKYSPPDTQIQLSAHAFTLAEVAELLSEDQIDHAMLLEQKDLPVVLVRVQDQGEGILPDDQQRIFDKFVRAPRSLTTPVRGSGLGLYICRRYIEAMGGKLWLEQSIPNEGSIFSFYLPRVEPPIEAGEQDTGEYKTA
jgi:signal transduction histidine kinase